MARFSSSITLLSLNRLWYEGILDYTDELTEDLAVAVPGFGSLSVIRDLHLTPTLEIQPFDAHSQ